MTHLLFLSLYMWYIHIFFLNQLKILASCSFIPKPFSVNFLKTRTFSYITVVLLSRNLTLTQYYSLRSLFYNLTNGHSNDLYSTFSSPGSGSNPGSCKDCTVKSFYSHLIGNCASASLFFKTLTFLKEYRPVIFQNVPQFGFVWCFLVIRSRLNIFGRNTTEMMSPSQGTHDVH